MSTFAHKSCMEPHPFGVGVVVNLKRNILLGIAVNFQICTKNSCFQPLSHRDEDEVSKHLLVMNCMNEQICTEKSCSQPDPHEDEDGG